MWAREAWECEHEMVGADGRRSVTLGTRLGKITAGQATVYCLSTVTGEGREGA